MRTAEILDATAPAARQLVSRARRHVTEERRAPVTPDAQRELLDAFLAAARAGRVAVLEQHFAARSRPAGLPW